MRVVIADKVPAVLAGLRILLEQQAGLEITGEVMHFDGLADQLRGTCPDVLLLDWELPGLSGGDGILLLRRMCPHTSMVAMSGKSEMRHIALAAGVHAFVSKAAPPEQLLAAIASTTQVAKLGPIGARVEVQHAHSRAESKINHKSSAYRRLITMVELEKRKGLTKNGAVIALAIVLLAAIAACLVIALTIISEIPFHHIFPAGLSPSGNPFVL